MSLIPTIYKSSDLGAPVLSGLPGALVTLLDAVLVNGYGSGEGARAPAGWSLEFTGTNKRAYRTGSVYGSGHYLRVDDSAVAGNARHAWWRSFEDMIDIDTGYGATPTVAQRANGVLIPKSNLLTGDERAWTIVACEAFFYLIVNVDASGSGRFGAEIPYVVMFAGGFQSRKPGDGGNFAVFGSRLTTYAGADIMLGPFEFMSSTYIFPNTHSGRYVARAASSEASIYAGLSVIGDHDISYGPGASPNTVTRPLGPDAVSGGIALQRFVILDGSRIIRGYLPNIYAPLNQFPAAHGDVIVGIPGLPSGTELVAHLSSIRLGPTNSNGYGGMVLFDISNEWPSA